MHKKINIISLGSSGGAPTKRRNCTSFLIKLESYGILIDCSEGTQRQLLKANYKISKLRYIFISHLHLDHLAGLVPLLATKSMFNIPGPLTIIGPSKIKEYINFNLNIANSRLNYELKIIELEDIYYKINFAEFTLKSYLLNHRVPSYGYRFDFNNKDGNIIQEKLDEYQLKPGPIIGKIKKDGEIILNGKKIRLEDISTKNKEGISLVYVGDTYLCENIEKITKQCDYLIIESTFQKGDEEKAAVRTHLTSFFCGEIAKKAEAKLLFMFHFSASYTSLKKFELDARESFENEIVLAEDFKEVSKNLYRS